MFFLLRMAFWLCVVCVLLPSGTKSTSPDAQIDASEAVTLASAAVSDVRGFCERQPDACVTGGKVAVALGHKAEAGARTLYEFITKLREKSAAPEKADSKAGWRSGHVDPERYGASLACAGPVAAPPRSTRQPAQPHKHPNSGRFHRTPAPANLLATPCASVYMCVMTAIDEIVENFTLLDEWDDRYRYVIELGRTLPPLPESAHSKPTRSKAVPARSGCSHM